MKRQILFVDDDPLVLQGLRRMLYSMRDRWDMEFADGGEKALALLAQKHFQAIVSDMRMPGMNGAELLAKVSLRYPAIYRLVLSGHADQDLMMKCAGVAHQFLTKPCNPVDLRDTIQRIFAMDATLKSADIARLVARLDTLPGQNKHYSELVSKIQNPQASLAEISGLISQDMAMTAKILKLVNSPFFGVSREITCAAEAVAFLGLEILKGVVLFAKVFDGIKVQDIEGFCIEKLWQHSLQTAVAARTIALAEGCSGRLVEESFTAGLLHDLGKLVLAASCPAEYENVMLQSQASGNSLIATEHKIIGANHAEIGGYLLNLWGLPAILVEAVTHHHEPARGISNQFGPLLAVHVANAICLEEAGNKDNVLDRPYLEQLGILSHLPAWREAVAAQAPATP